MRKHPSPYSKTKTNWGYKPQTKSAFNPRCFNSCARVARALQLPSADEFYRSQIEQFKEYENNWAWGLCPFHEDHSPSFCVNLKTGFYKCNSSSCGVNGVGIVSFVSALQGLSREDAVRWLEGRSWN